MKPCIERARSSGAVYPPVAPLAQIPEEEIPEALRILLREGLEGVRRTLVGARVPSLEIETVERLPINLDGEPLTGTRFRFGLLPRRLSTKLPAGCPLIS
jgi:diacylglycerol kinase family enzyme